MTLPVVRGKDGKVLAKQCCLAPGKNTVPSEALEALRGHKLVAQWFGKGGFLKLEGEEPTSERKPPVKVAPPPKAPDPKRFDGQDLSGYTIAEAGPMIAQCGDMQLLRKWLDADGRAGILARVQTRIDEIGTTDFGFSESETFED